MKNLFLPPLVLILFSFVLPVSLYGTNKDSLYCIEINGRVAIPKTDPTRNYKLILYCNGLIIDSSEVIDNEEFLLRVKKNSFYTIRIIKPGYLPMMISINTHQQELNKNNQKFSFTETCFVDLYGFQLSLTLLSMPKPLLAELNQLERKDDLLEP